MLECSGSLCVWLLLAALFSRPSSEAVRIFWTTYQRVGRRGGVCRRRCGHLPLVRTVQSGGVASRAGSLYPTARPARNRFVQMSLGVDPGEPVGAYRLGRRRRQHPTRRPGHSLRRCFLSTAGGETRWLRRAGYRAWGWRPLDGRFDAVRGPNDYRRVPEPTPKTTPTPTGHASARGTQLVRLRGRFAQKSYVRRPTPERRAGGAGRARLASSTRRTRRDHPHPLRATSTLRWRFYRQLRYAFRGRREATLTELQPEASARVYPLPSRACVSELARRAALVLTPAKPPRSLVRVRNIGAGTQEARAAFNSRCNR